MRPLEPQAGLMFHVVCGGCVLGYQEVLSTRGASSGRPSTWYTLPTRGPPPCSAAVRPGPAPPPPLAAAAAAAAATASAALAGRAPLGWPRSRVGVQLLPL